MAALFLVACPKNCYGNCLPDVAIMSREVVCMTLKQLVIAIAALVLVGIPAVAAAASCCGGACCGNGCC